VLILLVAHAVAAVCAPALVAHWGRRAFYLLAAAPAAVAVWALAHTGDVRDGGAVTERLAWVPSLHLELTFRIDTLAWLMLLVVGGIGALVLIYCAAYFDDAEVGLGRFAGVLLAFAGAMVGLVACDDMLGLYLFWELTTVFSYLLIGHYTTASASRAAATQALVVTTAGGLAMLAGIVLLGQRSGTYRLSEVVAAAPRGPGMSVAIALILVGALSKSALVPFQFWLPGAMAAPTPVSAYLHAAAMVKAGVYLVARLAPGFATVPVWRPLVLILGGTTMLLGAYRALRQHDLKLLLAYGTVSQLGFLIVLTGAGTRNAALAGVTMLVAHALYKATLFLVVGIIDHSAGTRDLRALSGLGRTMPAVAVVAALALASMAGLPPLLGFVGKEVAYEAFTGERHVGGLGWSTAVVVVLVAGSALTVAYSARFAWGAFAAKSGLAPTGIHRPGAAFVAAPAVLAVLCVVGGVAAGPAESLLRPYLAAFPAPEHPAHLGLWHGLTLPLALSGLTIALGVAVAAAPARVERAQGRVPRTVDADHVYRLTMRGIDRASMEITGAVQRGSLSVSLALILVVWVVLPGGAVLLGVPWPRVRLWDTPAQPVVAALMIVAAVLAARSNGRMRAVFLVGVTGYGTAFLFLLHGAPDLALTQVLVETVSLVVFVLVLRRLPAKFSLAPLAADRILRMVLGGLVGAMVTVTAIVAGGARTAVPASEGMAAEAVRFGGGRNIVNVILVDIRAWDTMGELSVVLVAATGVASLLFLRRRDGELRRVQEAGAGAGAGEHGAGDSHTSDRDAAASALAGVRPWLVGSSTIDPRTRSVIFEVVTRLVFHTVIAFAVYLLFSGHNNPGGGFAAGLVIGLGLTLRYVAGGRYELAEALPLRPGWLLGAGLFLSAGTGLVSLLAGGDVLQSWTFDLHLPLIGTAHLVTSLFFDIGVCLVVVGFMLDVLRTLGAEIDVQIEDEAAVAAGTDVGAGVPA
jgi:multicomponent Na+:H+ antiporter subunit A